MTAETERCGTSVEYVVLRPSLDVALTRATGRRGEERVPGHPALTASGPIRQMWQAFNDLGAYEPHVIDTSALEAAATADLVFSLRNEGLLRLTRHQARE